MEAVTLDKWMRSHIHSIIRCMSRCFVNLYMSLHYNYEQTCRIVNTLKYIECPLSTSSLKRLSTVNRKTLILDLDETLVHSVLLLNTSGHNPRTISRKRGKADFYIKVKFEDEDVHFCVYKRPFVDFFISKICEWFDLVIFTASLEVYGSAIVDRLDRGRNLLNRRYYRQHCTPYLNGHTKDLSIVSKDLSSVVIIDNSPIAYHLYKQNAIPIESWLCDKNDKALLDLLPFLDALRFTADVRSILGRC